MLVCLFFICLAQIFFKNTGQICSRFLKNHFYFPEKVNSSKSKILINPDPYFLVTFRTFAHLYKKQCSSSFISQGKH